jgi:hypothetical protein
LRDGAGGAKTSPLWPAGGTGRAGQPRFPLGLCLDRRLIVWFVRDYSKACQVDWELPKLTDPLGLLAILAVTFWVLAVHEGYGTFDVGFCWHKSVRKK